MIVPHGSESLLVYLCLWTALTSDPEHSSVLLTPRGDRKTQSRERKYFPRLSNLAILRNQPLHELLHQLGHPAIPSQFWVHPLTCARQPSNWRWELTIWYALVNRGKRRPQEGFWELWPKLRNSVLIYNESWDQDEPLVAQLIKGHIEIGLSLRGQTLNQLKGLCT